MSPEPLGARTVVEEPHQHVDDFVHRPYAYVARLFVLVRNVLRNLVQGHLSELGADGEGLDAAHAPPEEVLDLLM